MKRKTYHYREPLYTRKIKFTGAYAGVIGLFATGYFLFINMNFLLVPVMIVCLYTYWETYVSLSNPQDVTIDDKTITFSGCGKVHEFKWSEIKSFRIRESYSDKKIFLRINKTSLLKGRYWIHCMYFNDSDELFNFLRDKEYEIHPNIMKSVARRTNEQGFKERQAAQLKKEEKERIKEENKAKLKAERKAAKKKA